jgi:hypothetical protein
MAPTDDQRGEVGRTIPTDKARQGVTGHNVRAVLFTGLGLAILAGVILYFSVGVGTH